MTEKHDELCANCGHEHPWLQAEKGKGITEYYNNCDKCSCKKFTPKTSLDKKSKGEICPYAKKEGYVKEEDCHCFCCGTHSPSRNSKISGDTPSGKSKSQSNFGESVSNSEGTSKSNCCEGVNECINSQVFPDERGTQNHSPQKALNEIKSADAMDVTEGTQNQEEFNLSEKIWNLVEYCYDCEKSGEEQKDLLNKKDVKNFFKKFLGKFLDTEKYTKEDIKYYLFELAGDKLI